MWASSSQASNETLTGWSEIATNWAAQILSHQAHQRDVEQDALRPLYYRENTPWRRSAKLAVLAIRKNNRDTSATDSGGPHQHTTIMLWHLVKTSFTDGLVLL